MVRIEENPEWVRRWSEAVVAAALEDADRMQAHRDRMVHAARQRFRYAHVRLYTCVCVCVREREREREYLHIYVYIYIYIYIYIYRL